jgi:hypothetical protein
VWVLALALAGCGSDAPDGDGPGARTPEAPAAPGPEQPALSIGITEPNPAFIWSARARPNPPAPFRAWRDELSLIDPDHYRLVVDWGELQPDPDRPADLDQPRGGCMRATPPCLGWRGLREQLAALASRQAAGGWETLVVLTGTPEWAAAAPHPCERRDVGPRARMARADAMPAYRRLVADVLAAAAREGAELRWWSAWNEPNHPLTLSPQHDPCGDRTSTPAVAAYAQLAAELRSALDSAPGQQRFVLGELAGIRRSRRHSTGVGEFFERLPRELVCAAGVVSLHAYAGGHDPVDDAWEAIAGHGCQGEPRVWITETGAGFPPRDLSRAKAAASRRAACEEMRARLRRWYRDRRIEAAFQYTLREDDLFRVGLASTALDTAFPTLGLWQAWAGRRDPEDPPPGEGCSA